MIGVILKTILERFEEKYEAVTESGCWLWTAAVWGNERYGCFGYEGKMQSAHKLSLLLYKGIESSSDVHVCHKCDVTLCVNPEHLFIGSHSDNMKDMVEKGRHRTGREKLTEDDKEFARRMRTEGLEVKKIAEIFNIDRGYASKLLKGCQPKSTRKVNKSLTR